MSTFLQRIAEQRRIIYRQDDRPPLKSAGEALEFVNQVGFCLLFNHSTLELPNLWDISEGRPWLWKDQLPIQKQLYYGKRFQGKVGLVSVEMLAALYALTPTAEYQGDRFDLYQMGYLSVEANRLTGIVAAKGPLTTRALRQALGVAASSKRYRFSKMLAEAEEKFLIVKSGTARTTSAGYTYVWDSFSRVWPEIVREGSALPHLEAGKRVIERYVQTAAAATVDQMAELFALNREFVLYIVGQLAAEQRIRSVVEGMEVYIIPAS